MNFDFSTTLAEEIGGILEPLHVRDQLVYFFEEHSDPYLNQVSFSICQPGQSPKLFNLDEDKISRTEFPYYFIRSDIIVAQYSSAAPDHRGRVVRLHVWGR